MNTYKRHRFPPDIIRYAVWLYFRFNLSHRDIEDLLAQRGIIVSYESIRLWCIKFGRIYARRLKRRHQGYGDTFYIDEVFVKINGKQHYLWRAVDQEGEVMERQQSDSSNVCSEDRVKSPEKLSRINCEAMLSHIASLSRRLSITRHSMPTTGRSCLISRPGPENAG